MCWANRDTVIVAEALRFQRSPVWSFSAKEQTGERKNASK